MKEGLSSSIDEGVRVFVVSWWSKFLTLVRDKRIAVSSIVGWLCWLIVRRCDWNGAADVKGMCGVFGGGDVVSVAIFA
jgi:hypothetical protein